MKYVALLIILFSINNASAMEEQITAPQQRIIGSPLAVTPTTRLQLPKITFCNQNLSDVQLVCQFFAQQNIIHSWRQPLSTGVEALYNISYCKTKPVITGALLKLLISQANTEVILNLDPDTIQENDTITIAQEKDNIFITRRRVSELDLYLLPKPLTIIMNKITQ